MKKKIFALVVSIIIVCNFSSAYALTTLNEKVVTEKITSGVVLKNYDRFTEKGWLNINVVEVDLNDNNTELGLLNSENGLNTFQTVLQMVNQGNIVAAINGDFFNGSSVNGNTIGLSISDGKLLTTPYYENEIKDTFGSFVLDEDNDAFVGFFKHKTVLKNKKNNKELAIAEFNKISNDYKYPVVYTCEWGEYSPGSKYELTEMLVENGKVKEIRENGDPFKIPENGFVVSTYGDTAKQMIQDFKKFNKVEIDMEMDLDVEKIKLAVSGGAVLVKDGQIPETFSSNISGSNPRSAIGISKDGNTVFLVTVDGRQSSSFGMTQLEIAEFLKEKGVYNAINLDGGGSTTMVARLLGEQSAKTVNSPSGTALRMVTNAIGVFNNKKTGSLDGLVVKIPEENVFTNSKLKVDVLGYDKYYNPVEVDFEDLDFDFTGVKGYAEDGYIYFEDNVGTANITVSKGKVSEKFSVDVLSAPNEIVVTPKNKIVSLGENVEFSLIGKNKNGYYASLHDEDVLITVISGDGNIDGLEYIPKKEGNHIIEFSVQDTKSYALISVGESNKRILDSFEEESFNFVSYPAGVLGNASISSKENTHLNNSAKIEYDFTNVEATRAAYLRFKNPIEIDENATSICFKAFSKDEVSDYIKLKFVDMKGNATLVMAKKGLAADKWCEVEVSLNQITLPAKLTDIYIAQDNVDVKSEGVIFIDELTLAEEKQPEVTNVKLPKDVKGVDSLDEISDISSGDSLKLLVIDELKEPKILLDKLMNKKLIEKINDSAEVIIFNKDLSENYRGEISKNIQNISKKRDFSYLVEDARFINIDISGGGIRIADYNQWLNLKNEIKNTNENNVVILLNGALNGILDIKERKLFVDTLCDLKRATSKNIIVIHKGETTDFSMERGVKYVSVNNADIDRSDAFNIVNEMKFIEITINKDGIKTALKYVK